jgi:hypothetical protein
MRVLVIIRANQKSEAGVMPSERMLTEMDKYNDELVKAGVWQVAEGLHPSSKAKRVRFVPGKAPTVIDGPFAETKELIAGFYIWKVKSMDEALEWVKRVPDCGETEEEIMEIRPIFEMEDFSALMTEHRQREAIAAQE